MPCCASARSRIIGWVGLAWLAPIVGTLAYFLFGINRIHRSARALDLKRDSGPIPRESRAGARGRGGTVAARHPGFPVSRDSASARPAMPCSTGTASSRCRTGCRVSAMLAAIDAAGASVTLASYIFDNDAAGQAFSTRWCVHGARRRSPGADRRRGFALHAAHDGPHAAASPGAVAAFLPTRVRACTSTPTCACTARSSWSTVASASRAA